MQNIKSFTSISLKQMNKVKLMNRMDRKYWFRDDTLNAILEEVKDDYYVLEINGVRNMPYATSYFDTSKSAMFTAHHNGKLNRYKIRKRKYEISDLGFLEIKFKNNKGRTIKKRIPTDTDSMDFSKEEQSFINDSSPYKAEYLKFSLQNRFNRLTLVNKNYKERCTIDVDLEFFYNGNRMSLSDIAIVEIKTDANAKSSPLYKALRDYRLRSSGFSKYCIGKSLLDNDLKKNAFKPKLRFIEKTLKTIKRTS